MPLGRSSRVRRRAAAMLLAASAGGLIGAAPSTLSLPDRAYPESATSTADGTIYVGNMANSGIVRIRNGKADPFVAPGAFGLRSVYGVLADTRAGLLWACSNDLSGEGMTSQGDAGTAVKAFDLRTGEGRLSLRFPGDGSGTCSDFAVAADGTLYVTDLRHAHVLRLRKGAKALEVWFSDSRLFKADEGPDGLAFGDDGNLYLNRYVRARDARENVFFRIAIKGGRPAGLVALTANAPFPGADGMRHERGNSFIVVSGEAGTLSRVTMTRDRALVQTLRTGLAEPAGVAIVGRTAWVTEMQFSSLYGPKEQRKPVAPFKLQGVSLGR